jgi:hypothetical protein
MVGKGLLHLPGRLAPEFGILRIHGVSSGALVIGRNPSISALTLQKTDIFEIGKSMYLVPIAWLYVTVLMAVADKPGPVGVLAVRVKVWIPSFEMSFTTAALTSSGAPPAGMATCDPGL